ncbi:MAG: DUF1664 domain-containing protein [Xenococcaceae cyanobacterium]
MEDTNKLLNQILDKVSEIKTDTNILKDRLTSVEKSIIKLDEKAAGIDTRLSNVEVRLNTVENKLPDISEKFGELKNWRQISFIILAALAGWFAKSGRF